jgi:Zn-dependent M16 (insulinase) family peptidase
VLCGSRKYATKEPFVEVRKLAHNTMSEANRKSCVDKTTFIALRIYNSLR